jgi:hypothetical protein
LYLISRDFSKKPDTRLFLLFASRISKFDLAARRRERTVDSRSALLGFFLQISLPVVTSTAIRRWPEWRIEILGLRNGPALALRGEAQEEAPHF